ncbi:hypothetical protein TNCT_575391 [Trichonephila clavata]|uniref:Uncharacterized protein n=1 Tax=Trichonephila clavata TaxID=2740835 RepID=A0A8X6IXN4_TRICU|nr:hypothetical protein TNCT_575391 [Trichonephila clavata]
MVKLYPTAFEHESAIQNYPKEDAGEKELEPFIPLSQKETQKKEQTVPVGKILSFFIRMRNFSLVDSSPRSRCRWSAWEGRCVEKCKVWNHEPKRNKASYLN